MNIPWNDDHNLFDAAFSKTAGMILPFLIILWLGVAGCGGGEPETPQAAKKPPLVTVAPVETGEISRTIRLTGAIEPFRIARLASPAEGPVVNLRVREGDAVAAGDILVTIGRKTGVDALIASLQEEVKKEEDNLNRTRQLVESKALPAEQLDSARTSFEKVRAQLARARETEQDYEVSAPFTGKVSRVLVNEGDFVAPRTNLMEIYDPSTLVLLTTIQERFAVLLKDDMPVEIYLDAYPDQIFSGRITRLYPYLDARMRTRTIEITINEPALLLPGMFGRIRLVIEKIADAMIVPSRAVIIRPSGESVIFVLQNDKAIERKVETGIEEDGKIQIISGLSPGETIMASGQEKLKHGTTVRVSGAAPAAGDGLTPAQTANATITEKPPKPIDQSKDVGR